MKKMGATMATVLAGTGWLMLILAVLAAASLLMTAGCAGKNLGDGQVDAVEAATIRVAVGMSMSTRPETVVPAYAVTKTLLAVMDGPEAVPLKDLEAAMNDRIDALDLTPMEKAAVMDLAALVKVNIEARLSGLAPDLKLVVVRSVIEIVHETAAYRLNMGNVDQ
jgi:hypothetical protein